MAFNEVDASKRSTVRGEADPLMSYYGKTAQFRLNASAMAALTEFNGGQEVTKITVMHDEDANLLGIRPAPADSATAAKLSADNPSAPSRYFGFRGLAIKAGLDESMRWVLPVSYDKGSKLFVVNLAERQDLPIIPRAPRGSKSGAAASAEVAEEAPAAE